MQVTELILKEGWKMLLQITYVVVFYSRTVSNIQLLISTLAVLYSTLKYLGIAVLLVTCL